MNHVVEPRKIRSEVQKFNRMPKIWVLESIRKSSIRPLPKVYKEI